MSDMENFSKTELIKRISDGWNTLNNHLKTFSEEQLTVPTDPAGWSAKDHVMHLVVWEDGIVAALQKKSRHERMGISEELLASRDFDRINDVIFKAHQNKSWEEVKGAFEDVHRRMLDQIQSMTEDDLLKPYSEYQSNSTRTEPVVNWIVGDTFEHYAEHREWIDEIIANHAA